MADDNPLGTTAMKVVAHLKARDTLLWVASPEEGRVEKALIEAATRAKYQTRLWDCVSGVADAEGKPVNANMTDPAEVLKLIGSFPEKTVWILRDLLKPWLQDPTTLRALRNLAKRLPGLPVQKSIIILDSSSEIPPPLADQAILIKWELPDRSEIGRIFDQAIQNIDSLEKREAAQLVREQAIEAALGLSAETVASCYSNSIVTQKKTIVPSVIAAEKRRVINREKGIEWFEPDPRGLAAVGGLENLKKWLVSRGVAFSREAREFGLPAPRGILILGPPGTGKSLTAKAIAAAWGIPLLKLDMGGTKSKWVGESEANIRAALAVADTVGRCVVWLDEIEKALGGATSGAADGGVSTDALGTLLSWMQERKGDVFVVATANDVRALPPELMRKGRFDEIFFVDLPSKPERVEILKVTLKQFKRELSQLALENVAGETDGFVGAELAALVPAALFTAFADGARELASADLVAEARATQPLSKTAAEKITALREWSKGRARPASTPESEGAATGGGRNLDMMDL